MNYTILDIIHTPNAILHEFGLQVFEVVRPSIEKGENTILSFKGLRNVNSLFCNASIGKLYSEFPDKVQDLLKLEDIISESWQESIDESIELAQNVKRAEARKEAIKQLFHE